MTADKRVFTRRYRARNAVRKEAMALGYTAKSRGGGAERHLAVQKPPKGPAAPPKRPAAGPRLSQTGRNSRAGAGLHPNACCLLVRRGVAFPEREQLFYVKNGQTRAGAALNPYASLLVKQILPRPRTAFV